MKQSSTTPRPRTGADRLCGKTDHKGNAQGQCLSTVQQYQHAKGQQMCIIREELLPGQSPALPLQHRSCKLDNRRQVAHLPMSNDSRCLQPERTSV